MEEHTLKKPFTLLLILSHLNAFVLGVGGMGNVYAANQVVDTTKSPTTFIDRLVEPTSFRIISAF
jgi:hypothetical protein